VACLEAVVGTVFAWVLLGEHLALPQIVGGVLVLAGAFVAQTAKPDPAGAAAAAGVAAVAAETVAEPVPERV
jgi:drug/metabolite transporter (DMT)-like permease